MALCLDRDGGAPEQLDQLTLDRLGDPGRVDPVGDLREDPELEAVARIALKRQVVEDDPLAAVVLAHPGRLQIVLGEEHERVGAPVFAQSDGDVPACAFVVRARDLLDEPFGPRRSHLLGRAQHADDLAVAKAGFHRGKP